MKNVFMIFTFLISTRALADCTVLMGEYLCPKEAASDMMLGSQDVSITYKDLLKGFTLQAGKTDVFYELNNWNPAMSSNGNIDNSVQVMAICDAQNNLTLRGRVDQDGIQVTQDWIVNAIEGGVRIRGLLDNDELASFVCTKK